MSVGGIVLLCAVCLIFVFELVSLVRTIIKRKKQRAEALAKADDNSKKEDDVQ